MRGENLKMCPFTGLSCPFGYTTCMYLFSRKSPNLEVKIFEAKKNYFFFADAVVHLFSCTYTYLLWKDFLKVLLFHQGSAKFAVEITNFH